MEKICNEIIKSNRDKNLVVTNLKKIIMYGFVGFKD